MGFIATSCLKRRNRCHYQTLKNVSSHSWIKADGSNSQRVPNHPPQTPVCTPTNLPTHPPTYPGVNNICSICPMDKKANPSHWWTPLGALFVNNVFKWSSNSLFLMIKKFRQKLMLHFSFYIRDPTWNASSPNSEQELSSWPLIIEETL